MNATTLADCTAWAIECDLCKRRLHDNDLIVEGADTENPTYITGYDPLWYESIGGVARMATLAGWTVLEFNSQSPETPTYCPECKEVAS